MLHRLVFLVLRQCLDSPYILMQEIWRYIKQADGQDLKHVFEETLPKLGCLQLPSLSYLVGDGSHWWSCAVHRLDHTIPPRCWKMCNNLYSLSRSCLIIFASCFTNERTTSAKSASDSVKPVSPVPNPDNLLTNWVLRLALCTSLKSSLHNESPQQVHLPVASGG